MAGKYGSAVLSANQDTIIVPALTNPATVNILIVNGGVTEARVDVAIITGSSPAPEDYISIDRVLAVSAEYERSGVSMSTGEKVFVRSDVAGVVVRVHGF